MIVLKNKKIVDIDLDYHKKLFIFAIISKEENSKREVISDLAIMLNGIIICYGVCDVEVFKTELSLFERGDRNNRFLKIVQKKDPGNHINFSLCLNSNDHNVYFTKSESITIANKIQNLISRINTNNIINSYLNINKIDWNELLFFYINK